MNVLKKKEPIFNSTQPEAVLEIPRCAVDSREVKRGTLLLGFYIFFFGFCLRKAFNSNYSQKLNTMNKMRSDAFMSYFLAHSCCIIHSEQTQRGYRPLETAKG